MSLSNSSYPFLLTFDVFVDQPDSPAELGNKIYEMMAMAVGGRWGRVEEEESSNVNEGDDNNEESEVIEPSEVRAESDPWQD